MERIKGLKRYPQVLLLLLVIMVLGFAIVYVITSSRVGFKYQDSILVPSQENGDTVYSGKIQGKTARFTVSDDKTVTFQHGDKVYGPYTYKEDPTAIPKDNENAAYMTGVELRCGEEILFRGGIQDVGEYRWLYNEDGSREGGITVTVTSSGGITRDKNGKIIDPMEPTVHTILDLLSEPELVHKGDGQFWILGLMACGIAAVNILFADEIFRLQFLFSARNPEEIEPSDFELACRPIGWTLLTMIALYVFIKGLTM